MAISALTFKCRFSGAALLRGCPVVGSGPLTVVADAVPLEQAAEVGGVQASELRGLSYLAVGAPYQALEVASLEAGFGFGQRRGE